jgi:hypothetical protein
MDSSKTDIQETVAQKDSEICAIVLSSGNRLTIYSESLDLIQSD